MDTKKKMLSRGGNSRSAFVSVLAALLCILIGLVFGYLVLLAINAEHAWRAASMTPPTAWAAPWPTPPPSS